MVSERRILLGLLVSIFCTMISPDSFFRHVEFIPYPNLQGAHESMAYLPESSEMSKKSYLN
jgi:hypothetical protein